MMRNNDKSSSENRRSSVLKGSGKTICKFQLTVAMI